MNIWDYIKYTISRAGDGSGRASRMEYASYVLPSMALVFMPILVGELLERQSDDISSDAFLFVSFFIGLVIIVPMLSLCARRYHDLGLSGWLAIINLWPIFLLIPGQNRDNKYGAPPSTDGGAYELAGKQTLLQALRKGLNSFYWLF